MNLPFRNPFKPSELFAADPDYAAAPTPKTLWIELTSKCPFDCVFCTRKSRFGPGRNLDFDVYRKLIADLRSPDFIGLNYSGESIHYPRLLEAVCLARSTGAYTELVTAFSTISEAVLRGLVESGLDRLAVSLHTLDPEQYRRIYRCGSLELLQRRIQDFLAIRAALGRRKPRLDFCFVAMRENLDQLSNVVEYAGKIGVPEVFVHPIIGRHLVPRDFPAELESERLRGGFKAELRGAIAAARDRCPDVPITVLNPDVEISPKLTRAPAYYAQPLPPHARIYGCDQSPFESAHILAGGDVVVCEVRDEAPLGNLHERSITEIWRGDAYRDFRRKYVNDPPAECRNCVWKTAYAAGPWTSSIVVREGMSPQLLRGWHAHEGADILWSKRRAVVALKCGPGARLLRITGMLPPGPADEPNILGVTCNRVPIGRLTNRTPAMMQLDAMLALPAPLEHGYFEFSSEHLFRPSLQGLSNDARDLGFGLQRIEVCR